MSRSERLPPRGPFNSTNSAAVQREEGGKGLSTYKESGLKSLVNPLKLFRKKGPEKTARALYAAAVTQARQPWFYTDQGLPDTPEGRLEAVMLHVYLILHRLKEGAEGGAEAVAQALFDVLFEDMDQSLREMGVGDAGVPRRIKAMVEAFMGRIAAYDHGIEAGLDADETALKDALKRNFYRTSTPGEHEVSALAAYVRGAVQMLKSEPVTGFLEGHVVFPNPRKPNQP